VILVLLCLHGFSLNSAVLNAPLATQQAGLSIMDKKRMQWEQEKG